MNIRPGECYVIDAHGARCTERAYPLPAEPHSAADVLAALVTALYDKLGTWQAVADACNDGRIYSRTYYWRIARGTLPASSETAEALARVAREVTHVTKPRRRVARKNVSVSLDVAARLEAAKSARGDVTWDALMDEAAGLLEEAGR